VGYTGGLLEKVGITLGVYSPAFIFFSFWGHGGCFPRSFYTLGGVLEHSPFLTAFKGRSPLKRFFHFSGTAPTIWGGKILLAV